jgi:hypothetical protein
MKTSKAIDILEEIRQTHNVCTESNHGDITSAYARAEYRHGKFHSRSCVSIVHNRNTGKTSLKVGMKPTTVSSFKSHMAQVKRDLNKGCLELPKA